MKVGPLIEGWPKPPMWLWSMKADSSNSLSGPQQCEIRAKPAFTFLCERGLWFQFYENLPFFLQNTNWAYHLKCILSFWSLAPLLDFRRYKKPKHEYRDKQVQWSWGMSLIPLCLKEEEWRRGNYNERLSLSMQRRRATSEDAENGRGLPVLVRICCKCMWGSLVHNLVGRECHQEPFSSRSQCQPS